MAGVFLFAAGVSMLTGILSGLVPALQAGKRDLQGALRLNAGNVFGNAHRFRISQLLVIGQIALAVVVITAAGVMLRSLYRLANTDPGFHSAADAHRADLARPQRVHAEGFLPGIFRHPADARRRLFPASSLRRSSTPCP